MKGKNTLAIRIGCEVRGAHTVGLKAMGQRGSITVEAMVAFPIVLCVLFTMMFFIAEGRVEMAMFNGISSGTDTGASEYYTTAAIGEGISGLGQVLSENIFGGGTITAFANGVINSSGQLKAIPQNICTGILGSRIKKQVAWDMENELIYGKWNINVLLPNHSDKSDNGEDIYVEINQEEGISFGPFIEFEPLRMTAYQKCWTGGSSDIRNWLARAQPKTNGDNVYVTRTGECYHSSACTNSLDESCIPMAKDAAKIAGYRPCKLCSPDK